MKIVIIAARLLFSLIFLISGLSHFSPATIAYAGTQGVPLPDITAPFSGLLAIVGALSIILGFKARIGAILIMIFLIPISYKMHAFWNVTEPMLYQMQFSMFMKNVSMLGGAFLIYVHGTGTWSVDDSVPVKTNEKSPTLSRAVTV